jgi:transposase InsO family protein
MPFEERTVVDQREMMAFAALDERYTVTEVAEMFGVSRPTVRLWRDRYRESGRAGLEDRSHRPHSSPQRTRDEIEVMIVAEREKTKFGSKKIRRRLMDANPELELPARSTIDGILSRRGLVKRIRSRRALDRAPFMVRYTATEPGELMTADHKGEFRLRNGVYCYPLTLKDRVSHFVCTCKASRSTSLNEAWPPIENTFREFGCPLAFLSDNGPPFGASNARFSLLSVRLMILDIQPVFSRPGKPQDNGSHERMHRELKAFATRPAEGSFRAQQKRFDAFMQMYNVERPHEAIGQERPARLFNGFARPFPRRRPKPEYAAHAEKRKVSDSGSIRWRDDKIFISSTLAGQTIALEADDDDVWNVQFYGFKIGKIDERNNEFF